MTFELIVTVQFGRPRNSKLRLYCNACNSHGKLCTCPKGQLISGGNFCFFKSPKKTFFLKIFTRFLGIPGEISFTSFDHTFEILPKCWLVGWLAVEEIAQSCIKGLLVVRDFYFWAVWAARPEPWSFQLLSCSPWTSIKGCV